jgi:uncharacterized protein (UPF0276 family)
VDKKVFSKMNKVENNRLGLPNLGFGLGLRNTHFPYLMKNDDPIVDWFEIISENFIDNHGYARHVLEHVASKCPIVMHGVSMNLGTCDSLNFDYLKKLKELAKLVQPKWISDHLCWTGFSHVNTHDLLPLPLNEESLSHIIPRIKTVQDYLERPLIIENPSTYLEFKESSIPEWKFLSILTEETGCGLLLDVNNVYVSAYNHGFEAEEYIQNLPAQKIVQIHLAGLTDCGDYLVDTHDQAVPTPVWHLYKLAQELCGGVSTLLEWDAQIPEYLDLVAELNKAKDVLDGKIPQTGIQEKTEALSTPIDFQMTVAHE